MLFADDQYLLRCYLIFIYFVLHELTYHPSRYSYTCSWNKPKALGSYDVQGAEGWVKMAASNGDIYYYNPKSWKMVWEMPIGTTPCARCMTDFASALLINDNKKYCESCLNVVVQNLMAEKISPADIAMKMFMGNREKSNLVDFKRIKVETWMTHLVMGGMSAEEILKERREEAKKTALKKKEEEKRKKEEIPVYPCSRCNEKNATRDCFECQTKLCTECYERRHKKPPWSLHKYVDIVQPRPKPDDALVNTAPPLEQTPEQSIIVLEATFT